MADKLAWRPRGPATYRAAFLSLLAPAGLLAAMAFAPRAALAREHAGRHHEHAGDGGLDESDDVEDEGDEDAGPSAVTTRTPEQQAARQKLVAREHDLIRDAIRGRGPLTMQERQAIGLHWRFIMRLERVRELAEEQKDAAVVSKVDALIDRVDRKFEAKLEAVDGGPALTTATFAGRDGGMR